MKSIYENEQRPKAADFMMMEFEDEFYNEVYIEVKRKPPLILIVKTKYELEEGEIIEITDEPKLIVCKSQV
jgi:hypothetical protein